MSDDASAKVLIKRPSKIRSDARGLPVWVEPIESAELELVSTQTLQQILASGDSENRKSIENLAATVGDGVLARDPATGMFKIIADEELQQILNNDAELPSLSRSSDVTLEPLRDYVDADHLSLVSAQALRRVLKPDDADQADDEKSSDDEEIVATGFNPDDSSWLLVT
jgi:hypothetical protein